jgi:hypothetical protein
MENKGDDDEFDDFMDSSSPTPDSVPAPKPLTPPSVPVPKPLTLLNPSLDFNDFSMDEIISPAVVAVVDNGVDVNVEEKKSSLSSTSMTNMNMSYFDELVESERKVETKEWNDFSYGEDVSGDYV